VLGGLALPLAVHRAIGGQEPLSPIPMGVALATPVLAVLLVRLQGRAEGWRVVLLLLAVFVLYSVVR
jgi:PTS system mannose-specific IID component